MLEAAPLPVRPVRTFTEDEKDRIHARLTARCELDPETDCWIFTGRWDTKAGFGKMEIAYRTTTAHRVSAWLYKEQPFDLFDRRIRVTHVHCQNPACVNPDHLAILPSQAAVLDLYRGRGGKARRRLTLDQDALTLRRVA